MIVNLNVVILLFFAVRNIKSYDSDSPSSYHNQVNGKINDDFFISDFNNGRNGKFYPRDRAYEPSNRRPGYPYPPSREFLQIPSNDVEESGNDVGEAPVFSYDERDSYGPSNWGKINENCWGNQQSPVNLIDEYAKSDATSQPLIIDGFHNLPSSIAVENSGHSMAIRFNYPNGKPSRLLGGPLKVPYNLDNVHFHWGAQDSAGSEHMINSRRYSAEAHFVTYNSNFGSLAEASNNQKGLAVFAVLYELNNTLGATDNPFIKLIPNVIEPRRSYTETRNLFALRDLIKTKDFQYLSYKGSLTTPNCLETVTWMVSTKIVQISSAELAELRRIKDEKGDRLITNFRPLQKLNYRKVFYF